MRMRFTFALMLLIVSQWACRSSPMTTLGEWFRPSPHESALPESADAVTVDGRPKAVSQAPPLSVVDLQFDLIRVEFDAENALPSQKIWNHLDMMRFDLGQATLLARNGIRAGVGSPEAWPALRAIIEGFGGQAYRDEVAPPRGQPLVLDLGPVNQGAPIFCYDRHARLIGKSFQHGRRVISLDYAYHPEREIPIELRTGFEIRHDRGTMTWTKQGAMIRQVPSIDRHAFSDIILPCRVAPGEFLVLGVNGDSTGEFMVGRHFFTRKLEGINRETVLFFSPKILESQQVVPLTSSMQTVRIR